MIRIYNHSTGRYEDPKPKPYYKQDLENRVAKLEHQLRVLLQKCNS